MNADCSSVLFVIETPVRVPTWSPTLVDAITDLKTNTDPVRWDYVFFFIVELVVWAMQCVSIHSE